MADYSSLLLVYIDDQLAALSLPCHATINTTRQEALEFRTILSPS